MSPMNCNFIIWSNISHVDPRESGLYSYVLKSRFEILNFLRKWIRNEKLIRAHTCYGIRTLVTYWNLFKKPVIIRIVSLQIKWNPLSLSFISPPEPGSRVWISVRL
jgi:hypothetical protein